MANDDEIEKVLSALTPADRAKLEKYMAAHPPGVPTPPPEAKATAELKFTRKDGSSSITHLDAKEVWHLLQALVNAEETGVFEEESWNEAKGLCIHKVFDAYNGG
jgi:hypothetical protein